MDQASFRDSWSRHLAKLGLKILITFILLEAVLQVAAFAIYLSFRRPPQALDTAGQRAILCVGDSYTFGLGASSAERSYPGVLQQLLRKDDPSWQVINAGWPGRNSLEVLAILDRELGKTRPAFA